MHAYVVKFRDSVPLPFDLAAETESNPQALTKTFSTVKTLLSF